MVRPPGSQSGPGSSRSGKSPSKSVDSASPRHRHRRRTPELSRVPCRDNRGLVIDRFAEFRAARQTKIDTIELEVMKLEKRLHKLIISIVELNEADKADPQSTLFSIGHTFRRRKVETRVVKWEDDKVVLECYLCHQKFGFTRRKHHCRLCGRVVCADYGTGCSRDVPISILHSELGSEIVPIVPATNDSIRMCRGCKDKIFLRRHFIRDTEKELPILLQQYENMVVCRSAIEILQPRFRRMLEELEKRELPTKEELAEATKLRTRLMESFAQFDLRARQLSKLTVSTDTERRLQQAISTSAVEFLQENMLPLKSLPDILKAKHVEKPPPKPVRKPLSRKELKETQEQLVVMEEQRFLVSEMIEKSKKTRKFDEIGPLQQSLDDLDVMIEELRQKLGSEAFS